MINPTDSSASLAVDIKDIGALRRSAQQNSPEALKATAKQFEALFMNMMMKSMRDATPQDGMFDNEQTKMYTSMLDQQLSQTMASRGVGLADVLVRQLSNIASPQPSRTPDAAQPAASAPLSQSLQSSQSSLSASAEIGKPNASQPAHVQAFRDKLAPHAEAVSRETGIPARFMLGQAALETGWGRHEIRCADGATSHNLFGIKATGGWKGRVVETATTEYVNGTPHTKIEKFRAYDSYADAFRDYAKLLRSNPRYQNVLASGNDATAFAQGLQRAGYATDPNYAAKLSRIINHSLSA
jgi:peptidoglycan hydrolase FlgJ